MSEQAKEVSVKSNEAPIICRVLFDEICILANGEVVCSCGDPSGMRVYGNIHDNRIDEIFNGNDYREMRRWQLSTPPSSFCPTLKHNCGARVHRPTNVDKENNRVIKTLQLEPTSYCNLRCPECPIMHFDLDDSYRKNRRDTLTLETMIDIVKQLPDLEKLLFYNFGEPFMHPQALDFLSYVRTNRPEVMIHISTNGSVLTAEMIDRIVSEKLVDRLVFSVDGGNEATYNKYRVGGSFQTVLENMDLFIKAREKFQKKNQIEAIWQYILFDWNDNDADIESAISLAKKINIPIKWVLTHTNGASKKYVYGAKETEQLIAKTDVYDNLTCDMQMNSLWIHEGVGCGKYKANLSLNTCALTVPANGRVFLKLGVENTSKTVWAGEFNIGLKLRTDKAKVIKEVHRVPLPHYVCDVDGKGEVLVDAVAPEQPGNFQLFIDIVEEGVAWFSSRSSVPIVCELKVTDGKSNWDPAALVNMTYEKLFNKKPQDESLEFWCAKMKEGLPLEMAIKYIANDLPENERDKKVGLLRESLFKYFKM